MKKVLTLSAIGCLATIGAVFAAFTLDPTNVSNEITVEDVKVDLSSHVFSSFDKIDKFDFINNKGEVLLKDVPVNNPEYKFKPKDVVNGEGVIVGTTLDLHCNAYDVGDFATYIQLMNNKPKEDEPGYPAWLEEVTKVTPRGYAFKYEYDSDFLKRIEIDDTKPAGMEDWQYPIYKTAFSSGLTKSAFSKTGLSAFGVNYQDPVENDPNYREFEWSKDASATEWYYGTDSFLIQPDVVENPSGGDPITKNSGVIVFTGAEITENLFAGQFPDEDAIKKCADYLTGTGEYTEAHKQFSLKIKVSEYFKVEQYEFSRDNETTYSYQNQQIDINLLHSGNKYAFTFPVDAITDQLFKDGYEIDRFYIADESKKIMPLVTPRSIDEQDTSSLGLKVTLDSPNNGKSDITRFFKYGIDQSQSDYANTIYFDNTVAMNAVGYLPERGDAIKFEFAYKKTNTGELWSDRWQVAQLTLAKPLKNVLTLEEDPTTGTYAYDAGATPLSFVKGEINRFVAPVDENRSFDTFTLSDGTNPVILTSDMVTAYIENDHGSTKIDSQYYNVTETGSIVFDGDAIVATRENVLAIDIRNTGETALTVQSAQLTTTIAPKTYEYEYEYKRVGEDLSSGYFSLRNYDETRRTLIKGGTLNFRVYCGADNFWSSIEKLKGSLPYVQSSGFELALKNGGSAIPLTPDRMTDLDFSVVRYTKMGELIRDDTSDYIYDHETNAIKTTSMNFITDWNKDTTYEIRITIEYQGESGAIFNEAPFNLNITQ